MTALAITPLGRETHAVLPNKKSPFNKKDAEDILNPCGLGDYITIDEQGVWPPKTKRDLSMLEETDLMRWRPSRVFRDDPGALRVDETPMLRFPFAARHLAAFMVNGVGLLVAERYGDWGDAEPDPDCLKAVDPDSRASTAVIQAFAAYHDAKKVVPNAPDGASDVDALVRYLLAEPDNAPAQNTTTPAPMVAVGDDLAPLKQKRRTWRDVALPYMVEVFKAAQYTTAKEFYRALEKKAGAGSPFDRGTGPNSDSLFVREISEKLTLKTVQNVAWPQLKKTDNGLLQPHKSRESRRD